MPVNRTDWHEATIPGATRHVMRSRGSGRDYRIYLYTPEEEPPAAGYPVIYLLDANSVFGTMVESMRLQTRRFGGAAVIVGIGYETDAPFDPARHYDYTLPVPVSELPLHPEGGKWPEQGGADAFLTFVDEELKPAIERHFPIDRSRQTIFGHSLGGLFVLHTLFTKPQSFQNFVAGSPSLHWNERFLLEEERRFSARALQENLGVRVLLAVGELEKTHHSRINERVRELVERLEELSGIAVTHKEFAGEDHVSVLPVLISQAVRFATRTP